MDYFPVSNTTLAALHLGPFVKEKYSLSENTSCKLIKAGVNHTYLVTDGRNKYVLRVYSLNWRTREEIAEELTLLRELKANDLPVSYPLPDNTNEYIQVLNAPEGDRYAVLFTFAPGEKLHIVSTATHFKIGQLMAGFHAVGYGRTLKRVNYTPELLLIDSLKKIEEFLGKETEEMLFLKTTQAYLLEEFQRVDISKVRRGIVHLDIWFDNISVSEKNEINIFDFDFCGNGWQALDIAYYVMQLHNIEKYEPKDYQPKMASFLKGYESITHISDEEQRILPMLGISLYFFYLGIQCERYENWSNSFLNENYIKRFINGLVKRYFDIYKLGNIPKAG